MIREFRPLRSSFGAILITLLHQAKKLAQFPGTSTAICSFMKTENQIWRVKTHNNSRWLVVSCAWSHIRQAGWCCIPLLANRSAIQSLCFTASQIKNLQRKGAQLRHTFLHGVNLIEPTKQASYVDLLVYIPYWVSFQRYWSGTSCCKITPSIWSQSTRYSIKTSTGRPPLISDTQRLLERAWATVLDFTILLGIDWNRFGAISAKVFPSNHLSFKKRIVSPFPRTEAVAMLNKAWAFRGTWICRPAQGQDASVFCAHSHLHCKAHPKNSKLCMPIPPYSKGCCTFSQETKQLPPFACSWPFQRKPHLFLYIALMTHLGESSAIKWCITEAVNTTLVKISRPALFSKEAFQLGR